MKMMCPRCSRKYEKGYTYCPKCAEKLKRDYNRCSNPRSVDCERAIFEEDDIVCGYCGSETTYEKERKEMYHE